MKSKKGFNLGIIFSSLIFLVLFGFVFLFLSNLFFVAGDQYAITPLVDVTSSMANSTNISTELKTVITDTKTNYQNTNLPYDLIFMTTLLTLFISNATLSLKARKLGFFSFFGISSIGLMFFIALLGILESLRQWLFNNFIYGLFGLGGISTPFIDSIYNNFPLVAFFWLVIMIVINQFDSDILNRNSGRVDE